MRIIKLDEIREVINVARKEFSYREFYRRIFTSVALVLLIFILTLVLSLWIHHQTEEDCWDELSDAAHTEDEIMETLVDDTFRSLENIGTAFTMHDNIASSISAMKIIDSTDVGVMNLSPRLYLPNGRAFTEWGILGNVSAYVDYDDILKKMGKDGKYISCTKTDYLDRQEKVIELFVPVKEKGRTVAIVSAVMELDKLPEYINTPVYDGHANVLFYDSRDGTIFMDTQRMTTATVADYEEVVDTSGNWSKFISEMNSGRETYTKIKSKGNRSLYLYSVPSEIKGWMAIIDVPEDEAFAKSIVIGRLLVIFMALQLLIYAIYIVLTFGSIRKEINEETTEALLEKQKQLEEAYERAEAANIAKTNFLFNMSHDIRTPMNAIMGYNGMALRNIDNEAKVRDSLHKANDAGDTLLSIINDVLEMSRIEAGKFVPEERKMDIYMSFRHVEDMARELAKAEDIKLSFEFGEIRNRYIYCDYFHINRIFTNILSNAIKYNRPGGYVKVFCEQIDGDREGYAVFKYTFEDNGIGMSREFISHAFEQFSREDNVTVTKTQGTGLGLSLCKKFVDQMGGSISCESVQNQGSIFTVVLPMKIQKGHEVYDAGDDYEVPETEKMKGKRILLVEDNEMNREIAADILHEAGFVVFEAEDGRKAVDIVRSVGPHGFDAILMDIQMPYMNGYEATAEIRKMYPDIRLPIIALSANAFDEDKIRSLESGMDGHLAKPIDIKELISTLEKYI